MTQSRRNYAGKDVEMLMATSTIMENAIANKALLISRRSNWVDPFFLNLKTRIGDAMKNYLGVDSAKDLRQATQVVLKLQKDASDDLSEFHLVVMQDFRNDETRRTEILTQLGFKSYYASLRNDDQEGLINLLFQFRTNMTASLNTEITARGTEPALITSIKGYADLLSNSNITQETFKGTRKIASAEALAEFNAIYDEVSSIAKIAYRYFKDNAAVKDQFSYAKVRKALNSYK